MLRNEDASTSLLRNLPNEHPTYELIKVIYRDLEVDDLPPYTARRFHKSVRDLMYSPDLPFPVKTPQYHRKKLKWLYHENLLNEEAYLHHLFIMQNCENKFNHCRNLLRWPIRLNKDFSVDALFGLTYEEARKLLIEHRLSKKLKVRTSRIDGYNHYHIILELYLLLNEIKEGKIASLEYLRVLFNLRSVECFYLDENKGKC